MSVGRETLVNLLNDYASANDAQKNDETGLVISALGNELTNVLVSLDLTQKVVDEAIDKNVNFIVVHNPVIGMKDAFHANTPLGKKYIDLFKNDISVYVLGSDLEVSSQGTSWTLAENLGVENLEILQIISEEKCYKLVVCIPVLDEDYTTQIRTKLGDLGMQKGPWGAGVVGEYSHVSDYIKGIQNFIPLPDSNPVIGDHGVLSSVEVERFEIIVPESMINEAVNVMVETHPYEEVEHDIFPVTETRNPKGFGVIGTLVPGITLSEIAERFNGACVQIIGDGEVNAQKVAVSSKSDTSILNLTQEKSADLLIVPFLSHRDAVLAQETGLSVLVIGEYEMKQPVLKAVIETIESKFMELGKQSEIFFSDTMLENGDIR